MYRLITLACREHRACRLHDDRRRRAGAAADRRRAAGRRRRPRRPRRSRAWHLSASTPPAWTRPSLPGDNFYQLCQRHLGQEHADPGRQVQLRHVHHARRSVARAHPRDHRGAGQGSGEQDRRSPINAFLDTAAIEAKGLAPIQPWLSEIKAHRIASRTIAVARRQGRPHGHRQARSASTSGRTTRTPTATSPASARAGLGMPDRDYYLSADPKMAEIRAQISDPSDQRADAGRAKPMPPPAPRRSSISKPRSRGRTGPGPTAATRPRPTI